jgi:hypothetical protein
MDSVNLSNIGKRLHFREDDFKNTGVDRWARVTGGRSDKTLRFIDKHISNSGRLLEKMKTLAEAAQDESLSDIDRLEIQMEIGQLQHDLNKEAALMKYSYHLTKDMTESQLAAWVDNTFGNFGDSEAYKMLERAQERLLNGEDWNIAEVYAPVVKTFEENGEVFGYVDRYQWESAVDEDIPTVGDILKAKGRSVMDLKSAIVSAAEIDAELADLLEQRDKLVAFIETNGDNPLASVEKNVQGIPQNDKVKKLIEGFAWSLKPLAKTFYKDMTEITYGDYKDEQGRHVDFVDPEVKTASAGIFDFTKDNSRDTPIYL